jgi:GT2 family glycosyltransferase
LHYLKIGKAAGLVCAMPSVVKVEFDALDSLRLNVSASFSPNTISIIIPVFNAVEALTACLQSLVENTLMDCRVIVIDDASSDAAVQALLNDYRHLKKFAFYQNEKNLGFTQTVNKGIALAGGDDVVLLNADTQVTPGWLGRLRYAAYQADDIGTVTPFSNNAGAFSAPDGDVNQLPEGVELNRFARAIAQDALHLYPEVPTGNGFCLYVRRQCLDDVGVFDVEAFPRGYGEENDFCIRAGTLGWRHIIDDATYIYHVRSASFGEEKTSLIASAKAVIAQRYPHYSELVRKAFSAAPLIEARENVRKIQIAAEEDSNIGKPRMLYVVSTLTGGTPQTNADLMQALQNDMECFVLQCDSKVMKLKRYADGEYEDLARFALDAPIKAMTHYSDQYDTVIRVWLHHWAIDSVHIRHIGWHSLGLIKTVKQLGLPCVFSFHDFYTVCPTVKLLDNEQTFCGGTCTKSAGECKVELWPQKHFIQLKHEQITTWQSMFATTLAQSDGFITTTQQTKDLICSVYPALKNKPFNVIAHGRNFEQFCHAAIEPNQTAPLKIVFPGSLSKAKGAEVIVELALIAPESFLEIHIIGNVDPAVVFPDSVILHGAYKRDGLLDKLNEIKPNIGGILSLWPETWCHTLTELWAGGVPVIAFDVGAVGERIQKSGGGWLVSMSLLLMLCWTQLVQLKQDCDWLE